MTYPDADASVLKAEVGELKKTRNALILAHYYQRPSVQHVADFVGDSLELSRRAVETDADVVVFCGVRFMAETAAILNPEKTVLLPEPHAECQMAAMATAQQVRRRLRDLSDGIAVVSYVNCLAEVKAESYACCTSANAVQVVESVPHDRVLLVPDRNLASHVAEQTEKDVVPWDGHCYVHDPNITPDAIRDLMRLYPDAEVMVHPECSAAVRKVADFVGSTSQMLDYADGAEAGVFIVGTEEGMVYPLQERLPRKEFYATGSVCSSMRLTTLASVRRALDRMSNVVRVPESVRERAAVALGRMLDA